MLKFQGIKVDDEMFMHQKVNDGKAFPAKKVTFLFYEQPQACAVAIKDFLAEMLPRGRAE